MSQTEAGEQVSPPGDIRATYDARLEERKATLKRSSFWESVIVESRMVIFLAALAVAGLSLGMHRLSSAWIAVPILAFIGLLIVHDRARKATHRAERAVTFYDNGIARLEERWAGRGETGLDFFEESHPYAADLDLFGRGSLYERLCTARTRAGEETLAAWLLHPADAAEILARQQAIVELRPKIDLREDLALLGGDVRAAIDPEALVAWGAAPRMFNGRAIPIAAMILSAVTLAALLAWEPFGAGPSPFLLAVLLEVGFWFAFARNLHPVLAPLEKRGKELRLLASLLERLESEKFEVPRLQALSELLENQHEHASRQVARLAQQIQLLDSGRNQFFAPFAAVLFWVLHVAHAIDAWRGRSGPAIANWLKAIGEFEALCALASYAAENPADPNPIIETGEICFEAQEIGHPLLPRALCVRNDLSLGGAVRVFVISGSNMSGKSTMLRTVGINTVLALAGAPVRAKHLRVSPVAIGATLRIQDSLQAGKSRFFAEITRLRQLIDLARGPLPLLYLLDEVLAGTNSHDRRIGAEAIVHGLIDDNAIGLVSTHDLALAAIVDRLAPTATNVHFEDEFRDGTLHFDYRMRPGVVAKSNALELMRAVGLKV